MSNGCIRKTSTTEKLVAKVAGGVAIYLVEELGDARLRCAQLKKYVKEATDLIEKSEERDHLFEVAAHLIYGIPDVLFKLEKALDASAMAAARIDYEEIKDNIKPEKADDLEDAMDSVRLRYLQRRSGESAMTTQKQASDMLNAIALETEATGSVPLDKVMTLLARIESGTQVKKASVDSNKAASAFRIAARDVTSSGGPSPAALSKWLRNVIASEMMPTSSQIEAAIYSQASSRDEVKTKFKQSNPDLTDEQLEEFANQWEKNKDVVKDKHQG